VLILENVNIYTRMDGKRRKQIREYYELCATVNKMYCRASFVISKEYSRIKIKIAKKIFFFLKDGKRELLRIVTIMGIDINK
jgi:hypothetical protein